MCLIFVDLCDSWSVEMFVEECTGSQGSGREDAAFCFLSGMFIEMCVGLGMECLKPSLFNGLWVVFGKRLKQVFDVIKDLFLICFHRERIVGVIVDDALAKPTLRQKRIRRDHLPGDIKHFQEVCGDPHFIGLSTDSAFCQRNP